MIEIDPAKAKEIIHAASAKIASFKEFKAAYNKELALDFDPFRFFKVGENKISQILAAFLDPKGAHGQGDLFLRDFVKILGDRLPENISGDAWELTDAVKGFAKVQVKTEQSISSSTEKKKKSKRRLDLYLRAGEYTVAIENKIWAKDQNNQIKDYKAYMAKQHKGSRVLIYLTPYGHKPGAVSITDSEWNEGLANGSLCSMSYKHHILPMLESWEAQCKAERVRFFIREFKNHLRVKFLGGNHINMKKSLEPIIRSNSEAARELAKTYIAIEKEVRDKIDHVAMKFTETGVNPLAAFPYPPDNPTRYVVKKGFKISPPIEKSELQTMDEPIYVHLSEQHLELRLTFYSLNKSNPDVLENVRNQWEKAEKNVWEEKRIPHNNNEEIILVLNPKIPKYDLFKLFKDKVKLVATVLGQQYPEKPLPEQKPFQ